MPSTDNSTPDSSWIASTIIATLLILAILFLGFMVSESATSAMITEALFILAIAIGWIFGTYLSPDTKIEAQNFSQTFKGISIFVSGYLASKLDKVVEALLSPANILQNPEISFRSIGFIAIVLLTTIGVYFLRRYCFGIGEDS